MIGRNEARLWGRAQVRPLAEMRDARFYPPAALTGPRNPVKSSHRAGCVGSTLVGAPFIIESQSRDRWSN